METAAEGDRAELVFIVGLPRTGSTLTRAMLNRSPLVRIAGETHFVSVPPVPGVGRRRGYSERLQTFGDARTEDGLRRLVEGVYASTGKSFWSRFAATVDRTTFERALRASDRTPRAIFETTMKAFAAGRPVAGDKSPEHVYAVPTLLEWFPKARIIHTFRDPRAIYVSLRRKERSDRLSLPRRVLRRSGPPFEIYESTNVIRAWRRVARLHKRYEARYPQRYTLIRFEDLLQDPANEMERLCRFIGIPFSTNMLDQRVLNSSYGPAAPTVGIDTSAIDRWRTHLSPSAATWFSLTLGREMSRFGYGQ
jgi:hypothetical protein